LDRSFYSRTHFKLILLQSRVGHHARVVFLIYEDNFLFMDLCKKNKRILYKLWLYLVCNTHRTWNKQPKTQQQKKNKNISNNNNINKKVTKQQHRSVCMHLNFWNSISHLNLTLKLSDLNSQQHDWHISSQNAKPRFRLPIKFVE